MTDDDRGRFICKYCREKLVGWDTAKDHLRAEHPRKRGRLTTINGP